MGWATANMSMSMSMVEIIILFCDTRLFESSNSKLLERTVVRLINSMYLGDPPELTNNNLWSLVSGGP